MTWLAVLLLVYSVGLIALGLALGRGVRGTSDFFVAGRSLGPGAVMATFLAANIGAGSTVNATGLAYQDGWAAWWWNGSAGIGSIVFALCVGPALWRQAKRLNLLTVGDFLEHHYGRGVRGLVAALIWLGSFSVLSAQFRGAAEILQRVAGLSLGTGAALAALATVPYFVIGGLRSAVWVNAVQLLVIMAGFALAAPFAIDTVGGRAALPEGGSFWTGTHVGWSTLLVLGPAFVLSPGLIQKAFGASSDQAVRRGVALNGVVLMLFACLPVLLGLAAQAAYPSLPRREMALPLVLADQVPGAIGALALVAVFSAELSSADVVLFMLATSGARDFYRGVVRPDATDREVLGVARLLAVVGAVIGVGLTFVFDSVQSALLFFYQLLVVTLFAPLLGALVLPRAGRSAALTAILVGVTTLAIVHLLTGGAGYGWASPSLVGVLLSGVTYVVLAVF